MEGVGIEAHVEAAAVCGFDAVSLRPRHVRRWLDGAAGRTLRGLVATLGRHGIAVAELDPVMGWHDPSRWPGDLLPGDVVDDLDLAAALGATAVTALVGPGEPWDHGAGIDGLGVLAEAALARGVVVQLEPFGWSGLHDMREAAAVARAVGRSGVGVMVDTWHLERAGGGPPAVDELGVEEVLGVQVSDGPAQPTDEDLSADCFDSRAWPDDPAGELRPERVVAALRRRGWAGPVAPEVFGDASADPAGRARRAAAALDALLAASVR
jgi:sugar phosphate isomerase/epimerase